MNFAARFVEGLKYDDFLQRYGTTDQRSRWDRMFESIHLTAAQQELLASFKREMPVMCLAGAWCGDCVDQCPIFEHLARTSAAIQVRYFDRDASPDLKEEFSICGGARIPSVLFLSEDGAPVGRYGDRTLAKYRTVASAQVGAACSTGLVPPPASLQAAVIQEWLDQFERIQLILRTSPRLREKHGD